MMGAGVAGKVSSCFVYPALRPIPFPPPLLAQIPLCATSSGGPDDNKTASTAAPLLALALRLPPSASADWVVSALAAVLPQGTCMSSSIQLDIRTDIQVRILGQLPLPDATSSPADGSDETADNDSSNSVPPGSSVESQQGLWFSAALGTQAVLVPPKGPSVSLYMGGGGAQIGKPLFGVISAAASATTGATAAATPGPSGEGLVGGSAAATTALLVTLGLLLSVSLAVLVVICLRNRRGKPISANSVVAFNKLVSSHHPDSLEPACVTCVMASEEDEMYDSSVATHVPPQNRQYSHLSTAEMSVSVNPVFRSKSTK